MHEHIQKPQPPLEIIDPSTIFVGVDFVASLLGEEVGTIYNKSHLAKLPFPSYKSGRNVRFKYEEIMAWVDSLQPISVKQKLQPQHKSKKSVLGRPQKTVENGGAK